MNLVSESFEPVRKTSLNVSFTNWINPFPGLHFSYAHFSESFIFVCESFEAVHKTDLNNEFMILFSRFHSKYK